MRPTLLIIHPGGVGDVLLSLPVIRALRRAFPEHEVGLMAGQQVGSLLQACGEIDTVFPLERQALSGLFAGMESIAPEFRDWLNRCDLAVCWMNDSEGALYSTLESLGVRRIIVQSPPTSEAGWRHQSDRIGDTVRTIVQPCVDEWKLTVPEDMQSRGVSLLKDKGAFDHPLVAIHPGSGSRHKCCNPAVFAELMMWLKTFGMTPIVLGGPADDAMVDALTQICTTPPVIFQQVDLLTVAGILVQTRLFVGHDSGLAHLATGLHVPTIALFGPTRPERWRPLGPHVRLLSGASCRCDTWIAVEQCMEKPCLHIPHHELVHACREMLSLKRGTLGSATATLS